MALTTLIDELDRAAVMLERHRPDGPVDETCGCVSDPSSATAAEEVHSLIGEPELAAEIDGDIPIACTLVPDSLRRRVEDWDAMLGHVTQRQPLDGGVRLLFAAAVPLDELTALASAEQDCCGFLSFALTLDRRGIGLEVSAPPDAAAVVEALFGTAA